MSDKLLLALLIVGLVLLVVYICRLTFWAGKCPHCGSWFTLHDTNVNFDDHYPACKWVRRFSRCSKCKTVWNRSEDLVLKDNSFL